MVRRKDEEVKGVSRFWFHYWMEETSQERKTERGPSLGENQEFESKCGLSSL
jgi:hypothetical protein